MPQGAAVRIISCLSGMLIGQATPTLADRLVLVTGRAMVVASASLDGDVWMVRLRSGGQARIRASLVRDVEYRDDMPADAPGMVDAPASGPSAPAQTAPRASIREDRLVRPFAALVERAAAVHGVDHALVHAVIQAESNYQPRARSPKGAKGLMQLMPDTARAYGLRDPY